MRPLLIVGVLVITGCGRSRADHRGVEKHEFTMTAGSIDVRVEFLLPRGYEPTIPMVRGKYVGWASFDRKGDRVDFDLQLHHPPLKPADHELRALCPPTNWGGAGGVNLPLAHARGQDGSESVLCMYETVQFGGFRRPAFYTARTLIPYADGWLLECSAVAPGERVQGDNNASHWSRAELDELMRTCATTRILDIRPTPEAWYRG